MATLQNIVSLAKRRGFIYPGSEIYGGMAGTWDYGPLGTELKRNLKQEFWRSMVQTRNDVVGLDAAILMNPRVWEASGHVENFTDPLVECEKCKKRFKNRDEKKCPECGGKLTKPRQFNLLVEARLGALEDTKQAAYLRGEITQGVHVNFKNVIDSSRVQIPFGIAQIGKAFRNEINPQDFTFRSREFEQMELQFYIKPDKKESDMWYEYWKKERAHWYRSLGMNPKHIRFRQHAPEERAHYAQDAWDIEYQLDGEWREFEGIHHRGDWDLKRHEEYSGVDMRYTDPETGEKYLPWIIETSGGVDRAVLFLLIDAYEEENVKGEVRTVMKLHPALAPYKAAVFPLLANKPKLVAKAREIYDSLKGHWMVAWDDRGNIGKRYRSQDEIGTPFCITIDFDSFEHDDVTVRDRDTMKQKRVAVSDLEVYLAERLTF